MVVASTSMYAHNQMDGRILMLQTSKMIEQAQNCQPKSDLFGNLTEIECQRFIESSVAVSDCAIARHGDKLILVAGFNDGALCLTNLSDKAHQQNKVKPIFQTIKNDGSGSKEDPYGTQWSETSFEHADTIVSVDHNQKDKDLLLSASKDGALFVWKVNAESTDEMLVYQSDLKVKEQIMRAKWISTTSIVFGTSLGNVYCVSIGKDAQ